MGLIGKERASGRRPLVDRLTLVNGAHSSWRLVQTVGWGSKSTQCMATIGIDTLSESVVGTLEPAGANAGHTTQASGLKRSVLTTGAATTVPFAERPLGYCFLSLFSYPADRKSVV